MGESVRQVGPELYLSGPWRGRKWAEVLNYHFFFLSRILKNTSQRKSKGNSGLFQPGGFPVNVAIAD